MTTLHSSLELPAAGHKTFRAIAVGFAVLLAAQSIWLLLPQLTRSAVNQLPIDKVSAEHAADDRAAARRAALFGLIRGDLWAASAFTYADLLWTDTNIGANSGAMPALASAVKTLNRALTDSPHQFGAWLLLADLALRFPAVGIDPSGPLKMSYYTGPSDGRLVPLRLWISVQLPKFSDVEMRQLVDRDIRLLLSSKQTSEVTNAYGAASPAAKTFIEQTVKDADPTALDKVRTAPRMQNIPE
jgi:hypothetical protein